MPEPTAPSPHAANNVRGILAMLASMAFFIANDTLMKLVVPRIPTGEAIFFRGLIAMLLVLTMAYATGAMRGFAAVRQPAMLWRTLGEVGATLLYLTALFRMPIANATAILQIVPLATTAVAALLLAEHVGWRRWSAAVVGLAGVLLIIKPGPEGFNAAALFALAAVGFIVLRDLLTRSIPHDTPALFITVVSAAAVTCLGAAMSVFEDWLWPTPAEFALLASASIFLVGGYLTIIVAMRAGEVSVVAPFRYSIILWALLAGYLFWGDIPAPATIVGIVVVVAAGLYTFHREARLKIGRKSFVRA